jgi:hypothetical protein
MNHYTARQTDVAAQRERPRYSKPGTVVKNYDIPRYRVFELLKAKAFRSVLIKRPGSKRGLRLIDLDSLESFLAKFATGDQENE